MSLANLGSHWWVILIIVVLLFGAPKLPGLAKSMGQSMRIFKNEIKTGRDEDAAAKPADPAASTDSDKFNAERLNSERLNRERLDTEKFNSEKSASGDNTAKS